MTPSLCIPIDMQYGIPAAGEARQGRLRRAVAQAIERHLFARPDGAEGSTSELTYERALCAFAVELQAGALNIGRDWIAARALWDSLLPVASAEITPEAGGVAESVETVFCLGFHTLCAVLARQYSVAAGDQPDDADDADDADLDGDLQGADYADVLGALAEQLRQATSRWQRQLAPQQRAGADDRRVVAGILLDQLLSALGDWFAVTTGKTRHRDGKPHTPKIIQVAQPELAERIRRLLDTLPLSFSPQPLRQPVAYALDAPDAPVEDAGDPCSSVDLIGYRGSNALLRRLHRDIQSQQQRPPAFARYVAAINLQQAVAWRINRPLLHWLRRLIDFGNAAPVNEAEKPLREWIEENLYRPTKGQHKTANKPAEFLDSPLARLALDELCPSDAHIEPPPFYLPWKADYRGRIYAATPWLTPQGGDVQRALLEFARGQVLDAAGVCALRRHGGNLVKRDRLLADLGVSERSVATLAERERWVGEQEDRILKSAADPLAEPFWREVADEPMQFLAFCLAYRQWMQQPDAPIHLPVQIDGTCNGIQHIAALTGDAALARAVNVLPRADGLPADIYSELAAAARQTLGRLEVGKSQGIHRAGLELADAWLAGHPKRAAWLARNTAKPVVMTIPYGASHGSQAQGVLEKLEEDIRAEWTRDPPPLDALDALIAAIRAEKAWSRRGFIARCTRDRFAAERARAFGGDDALVQALARQEWERLRTLGAYVALALVAHLRGALDRDHPAVSAFADWLKHCASACAGSGNKPRGATEEDIGLPLLWLTPLGFPVVQNQFIMNRTSVTASLGARKVKLEVRRLSDVVDPHKQRDALLPNLIHSLDATHLLLTLLAAKARGIADIGSIHDCLLVHPNQAESLARTVRQTFAELYAPDVATGWPRPLREWYQWQAQVVTLRTLPHRGTMTAMLAHPDGLGERLLAREAEAGDAQASAARAWLARVREQTSPPELCLMLPLLDQAAELPTPDPAPRLPQPPITGALALSETAMSAYFFS